MSSPINVALVGVGNCASSLVQGVDYYRGVDDGELVPGVMHPTLGGYGIGDIQFTAAFDVVSSKVGHDLSTAIFDYPNNTVTFNPPGWFGVEVMRGMVHDGIGEYYADAVDIAPGEAVDVAQVLSDTRTDVVVNYLPVGSEEATKWYVEQALAAGCAFVNCIPVFIAREPYWAARFERAGLPVLGDDIKSQVGATIVHRVLTTLFADRGVRLDRTYQLNFGGNMDFRNMLERSRLESKKESKTNAVLSVLSPLSALAGNDGDIHVGPSDHVPWLEDRKFCYIRMEGTTFGDVPLNLELKLEVVDSPNSAGVVIDAVRCAKLALDRGDSGSILEPSAYFFKSPMRQVRDDQAREELEAWIVNVDNECAPIIDDWWAGSDCEP